MVQQEYNEKMLTLKAWAFDCSVESGYAKHPGDVDISKSSTLEPKCGIYSFDNQIREYGNPMK